MAKVRWFTVFAVILILSAAFITLPSMVNGSMSSDDWPMYQHDPAHTGTTNSSAPKTAPAVLWSIESKGYASRALAIAGGIVYASTRNLYAYNASTGEALWNVTDGGESAPIFANGVLYTGAAYGTAYNASTGAVIWSAGKNTSNHYSDVITYYEGIFYTQSESGAAQARNATTGEVIWTSTQVGYYLYPAISEGILYCTGFNGSAIMRALNAYNGTIIWETLVSYRELPCSPTVSSGHVYIGCQDRNLYCLEANSGKIVWNYTTGGWIRSAPAVADGIVYFGSADFYIYALNASTGQLIWSYKTKPWSYNEGYITPAVANGTVYVGALNGELYGLDAYSGKELWSLKVESEYDSLHAPRGLAITPTIAYGNIYLVGMDHFITAIGPSEPKTTSTVDVAVVVVVVTAVIVPLLGYLISSRYEKRRYYAEA